MKDRITQFLKSEGISPAEFADKIGVQRSSVSHVLNGRNYPSASFIQKMLSSYKTLNSRWLLLGEGEIFETKTSSVKEPMLFQVTDAPDISKIAAAMTKPVENPVQEVANQSDSNNSSKWNSPVETKQNPDPNIQGTVQDLSLYLNDYKTVERIVFFFADKTFNVYTPSK